MDVLRPFQFKMTTNAIYLGFPLWDESSDMIEMVAGCSIVFLRNEGYYDLHSLLNGLDPVDINLNCVQMSQELSDNSDQALAYCKYLGQLVAQLRDAGSDIYPEILDYIGYMDPYYKTRSGGIGIELTGEYEFALAIGASTTEIFKRIQNAEKDFVENESKPLTEKPVTPSQGNVFEVQFGSKRDAAPKNKD